MTTLAYAAQAADLPLIAVEIARRVPRPDDVVIEIRFCGVCHTDLHIARNHAGHTSYPVVPGHEIIGRIAWVGGDVENFKAGDTVGVGCMVDSCGHCDPCEHGQEQHCQNGAVYTYNSTDKHDHSKTYGGYSKEIVVSERFVLRIPDGLDPAGAAPLLCAGITTWEPLRQWNVGPGSTVGIVGLGGLGHMAIKLAKALGAEVTLLTRSPGKESDARSLGADHVVLSTSVGQMQALAGSLDLIIDTVPYEHDVNPYLPLLRFNGAHVLVGYMGPLNTPVAAGALVFGRKALAGSFIGGVAATQQMLDFCALHGITSDIELIEMADINHAYDRLLASDVKYRFVIDMATLPDVI
jgi:uncharacterized zinc-type alcohol dehydrogenase-like protein